jgi:uncharacterized RDD family membrane protein YckC
MDQTGVPALGHAPDRAIRGRLGAIVVDGVLVGLLCGALAKPLGGNNLGGTILAALVLQFLYFFGQEASGGKTIGKRHARLRVVNVDGSPPTLQQVAIRNALRVFDTLPLFYASGLVSVMGRDARDLVDQAPATLG